MAAPKPRFNADNEPYIISGLFSVIISLWTTRCEYWCLNSLFLPNLKLSVLANLSRRASIGFDRKRTFPVWSCTQGMSSCWPEVEYRRVCNDLIRNETPLQFHSMYISNNTHSIVPEGDIISLPFISHLEIRIFCDLRKEELQNIVRLGFGYSNYMASKTCEIS